MIDNISTAFLFLGQEAFIIPLIVLGYIWIERALFYNAACMLLFALIFNTALKDTFQVPLSPTLHKAGFAFPSGHMQAASSFYGWFVIAKRNLFINVAVLILLIGIAIGLVHFHYHNIYDIAGALVFTGIQLFAYYKVITRAKRYAYWIVILLATLLLAYIDFHFTQMNNYVLMAYFALLGFMTAEQFFGKVSKTRTVIDKVLQTVVCFACVIVITHFLATANNLHWLVIGFIIPCTNRVRITSSKS